MKRLYSPGKQNFVLTAIAPIMACVSDGISRADLTADQCHDTLGNYDRREKRWVGIFMFEVC